jgi:hypothetical protein
MLEHSSNVKRKIQVSLRFSFRFNLGFIPFAKPPYEDYHLRWRGDAMDDETIKATKKFDAEEAAEAKVDDRASEELRIFDEQGAGAWSDVRQRLLKRVQDFDREEGNGVLVVQETKQEDLTIRAKSRKRGDREVTAHFDTAYHEIEYYAKAVSTELPDIQGKFQMTVTTDNKLILVDAAGQGQSAQYAANQIFDALLTWGK